ncbi:solute carrier family 22 member 12-like [Dermacentor variabilis]|uniref:solute carrier family 22 member 12-like n=1 Tax=Dermacentor variabilis TaxID=34621 RepID=UPI003F5C316F
MRKMMYLRLTRKAAFIGEEDAKEEALKMSLGHEDDLSPQPEAQNPAQEQQPVDYNATLQQQPATAPVADTVDVLVPAPTNRRMKRIKSISKNPPPQMDTTRQEGGAMSPNRARRRRKKKRRQPSEAPSPPQSGGDSVARAAQELRRASEAVASPGDHSDAPVETGAPVSVAGFESDAKSMAQNQGKEGEVRRSLSTQGGDQQKEAADENQAAPGEDSIVAIFGGNGAYQRLSLGFAIMTYFAVAVHIFLDTVIAHDVRFACRPPSWANESVPPEDSWTTTQGWSKQDNGSACHQPRQPESGDVTAPCTAWLYANSSRHNSIVQEWDLVCSRQWLRPFTRFGFIAGGLVAWVLPFLIDRAGRRPTILLGVVMASASSLAIYFVKSLQLFMLFRCVLGLCLIILYITSFVLMFEIVSSEYVALFALISQLGFSCGQLFVGMLDKPRLTWRSVQLCCCLPVCACVIAILAVSESPRWLVARGNLDQAEAVMMRAARLNGVRKRKAQFLWRKACNELEKSQERWSMVLRTPFRGLLMSSTNFHFVLVMLVTRFSCTLVYLSVVTHFWQRATHGMFRAKHLATMRMVSVVTSYVLIERYGRQRTSAVGLCIAGVTWTLTAFVQNEDDLEYTVLVVLGLFAQAIVHCVLSVMNVELFPQHVLTFAYCWGEASNVLGALSSPYIMLLGGDDGSFVPLVLFAVLMLLSSGLVLTVPETRRQTAYARAQATTLFDAPVASRINNVSNVEDDGP